MRSFARVALTSTTALLAITLATPASALAVATATQEAEAEAEPAPQGDEVVVVGLRSSLEAAATIKREAVQVVESIVAEDIGKFPDPTTAAALQRVPGVQVTVGNDNQITGVRIRGINDLITTLDGREIISGIGRSFDLQDLPASALARVDVYKTSTANLIEGGIAGIIDLQINKPFNFRQPRVIVNLRGNYSSNRENVNPQGSILLTDRWDTGIGEIGALLNVSYSRNDFHRPYLYAPVRRSTATAPFNLPGYASQNVAGGVNEYGVVERPQAQASLQWQASPSLQVYADGIYAGYRSEQASGFVEAQLFNTGTQISNIDVGERCFQARVNAAGFNPTQAQITARQFTTQNLCEIDSATYRNATSFSSTQARKQTADNYMVGGGFVFERGPGQVKFDIAYQQTNFIGEVFIVDVGKRLPEVLVNSNGKIGAEYTFTGDPLANPAGMVFRGGINQNFNKSEGELFQTRLDGKFEVGGFLKRIEYGLRFASRGAEFNQALVNRTVPGGDIGGAGGDSGTPVSSVTALPSDFLTLSPGIPGINGGARFLAPNIDYLNSDAGRDVLRGFAGTVLGDPAYQPERRFVAREKTLAGYVQFLYDFDLGGLQIDGTLGVRPSFTGRRIAGAGLVSGVLVPQVAKTDDTDILPNASARVRFGDGFQARFVYAKAIRRPPFDSLNPGISYIVATNPNVQNNGSAGEPNLRPQKSQSFDASLEYFFRRGYLAVGVYYRDITDRVISSASLETIDGIGYNITRPRNVGQATLKGIEAGGQAFFDFLPGALSGLGLQANFTYADSEIGGADALAGYPLQGVSKYNFNVGLLYEKYGFSGRLIYNYRSKYYDQDTTGLNLVRPVTADQLAAGVTPLNFGYVRPAGRLDFGLAYEVNDMIRVDVGGTNILGTKYRSYFDEPGFNRDIRWDDTSYTVGVRIRI